MKWRNVNRVKKVIQLNKLTLLSIYKTMANNFTVHVSRLWNTSLRAVVIETYNKLYKLHTVHISRVTKDN